MAELKEIETSDGFKYQVYPVTGRRALSLDRKATAIVFDLFGKVTDKAGIKKNFIDHFGKMSEDDFNEIVSLTIEGIVFKGSDTQKSLKLDSENVWDHFTGRIDELYMLIILAWEAYNLTPFARIAKKVATGD